MVIEQLDPACAAPGAGERPRIRVAVLMGGRSTERDVSLATGRQVIASLNTAANSSRFRSRTSLMRCSIVSTVRNRVIVTGCWAPMRWARLMA